LGQIATTALNNTPVILNSAQFQCAQLVFNSTLTGNVSITFPTSFTGPYIIQNNCTGSSAFVITLQTTVAGGQIVGCPFGEIFDVFNDGTNIKFRNFGRIGRYEDWMCSSAPAWISACTVPPYLTCDGSAFSSAAYPTLTVLLGGTTLPDPRGRARLTLDGGTNRITSSNSGFSGTTIGAAGGSETVTLSSATIPITIPAGTVTMNTLNASNRGVSATTGSVVIMVNPPNATLANTDLVSGGYVVPTSTSFTFAGTPFGGGLAHQNVQPSYVGGITMVRAG
jgi:microcystin-dependent protein